MFLKEIPMLLGLESARFFRIIHGNFFACDFGDEIDDFILVVTEIRQFVC